jgi:hypothetical protein
MDESMHIGIGRLRTSPEWRFKRILLSPSGKSTDAPGIKGQVPEIMGSSSTTTTAGIPGGISPNRDLVLEAGIGQNGAEIHHPDGNRYKPSFVWHHNPKKSLFLIGHKSS